MTVMSLRLRIWSYFAELLTRDAGVPLKSLWLACFFVLFGLVLSDAAPLPSPKPRLRPYVGIGVLLVSISDTEQADPLYLYDEPALSRQGTLNLSAIPPFEWIFGTGTTSLPLIVAARRGAWLRVAYDDAGREAWLNPDRRNAYLTWNSFLKVHVCRMLPGLQKKYYQLYQLPGKHNLAVLSVTQSFKVLRLENDWAQIVPDQNTIAWVRWRDEDGRLLMGITTPLRMEQP